MTFYPPMPHFDLPEPDLDKPIDLEEAERQRQLIRKYTEKYVLEKQQAAAEKAEKEAKKRKEKRKKALLYIVEHVLVPIVVSVLSVLMINFCSK